MADAKDIIAETVYYRRRGWPHLRSLALTSNLLREDERNSQDRQKLLLVAGMLAQVMPKLNTFVLWIGGRGHASAFTYRANDGGSPSITWRATWGLEINARVVEEWQKAADAYQLENNSRPRYSALRVKNEHVGDVVRSVGDAIRYLELPCQVAEPASVWQMRMEGESNKVEGEEATDASQVS